MPPTHVTLRVKAIDLDTLLETVIDEEQIPVVANIGKVVGFFAEDLPQEVLQQFIQQFTVFLYHICEAGDEANLIREYLGNCLVRGSDSEDLPNALSALTGKPLPIEKSLKYVRTWVRTVVSVLDEPYITRLVVASLLSGRDIPERGEEEFNKLYLSLLK